MKKFLLALVLCLMPAAAKANWAYVEYSPGWYLRTNGVANDGIIYYRSLAPCGCYYNWYSWGPITAVPGYQSSSSNEYKVEIVNYTRNWKTDMVKAMSDNKDNELFLMSIQASGLPAANAQQAGMYGQGSGYVTSGLNTISQGFAVQGSTNWGYAAVPANPAIDVMELNHQFNRNVEGMQGLLGQGYVLSANLNAQSIAGAQHHDDIALIGDALTKAILANKTQQQTSQWQRAPAPIQVIPPQQQPQPPSQQQGGVAPTQPQGQQPVEQPPADPMPDNRQGAIQSKVDIMVKVKGGAIFEGTCLSCHTAGKNKDAADFSGLLAMSPQDRTSLAVAAYKRITTEIKSKPRMPKDGKALSEDEAVAVATYIAP